MLDMIAEIIEDVIDHLTSSIGFLLLVFFFFLVGMFAIACKEPTNAAAEQPAAKQIQVTLHTKAGLKLNDWKVKLVKKDNKVELHDIATGSYIVIEGLEPEDDFIKIK